MVKKAWESLTHIMQGIITTIVGASFIGAFVFAMSSNAKLEVALNDIGDIKASTEKYFAKVDGEIKECRAMAQANTTDILLLKHKVGMGHL